jgi:hypothetical protein
LTVKNFGNTHAKMLAYDRAFVALTSFVAAHVKPRKSGPTEF